MNWTRWFGKYGHNCLGGHTSNRDNNFNLIRMFAASAVLFSHSFALSTGLKSSEPLALWLGTTPGVIAVDIFFITSGFLITSSLLARENGASFIRARIARIFPALFVENILVVTLIGVFFTSLALDSFFLKRETWIYLARNIVLVTGVDHVLPGAFEQNPWRAAVNAPLWTLPYELAMYSLLLLFWWTTKGWKLPSDQRLRIICGVVAATGMTLHIFHYPLISHNVVRLVAMFFSGSVLYLFRYWIPLSAGLFFAHLAALMVSLLNKSYFTVVYPLVLPYMIIYLAFAPGAFLRKYNQLGDYSYGTYIYAWPVQQMSAALFPGITPIVLFFVSLLGTLIAAIASWHGIEKRVLRWAGRH